jgi:hypothetical protein
MPVDVTFLIQLCFEKDTTMSGVQHKNLKSEKCFLKKIYTPKLKEK